VASGAKAAKRMKSRNFFASNVLDFLPTMFQTLQVTVLFHTCPVRSPAECYLVHHLVNLIRARGRACELRVTHMGYAFGLIGALQNHPFSNRV